MSESLGNNPENFNPGESSSSSLKEVVEVVFEVVLEVVLEVVFEVEEWRRGTGLKPFSAMTVEGSRIILVEEEEEEEEGEASI